MFDELPHSFWWCRSYLKVLPRDLDLFLRYIKETNMDHRYKDINKTFKNIKTTAKTESYICFYYQNHHLHWAIPYADRVLRKNCIRFSDYVHNDMSELLALL